MIPLLVGKWMQNKQTLDTLSTRHNALQVKSYPHFLSCRLTTNSPVFSLDGLSFPRKRLQRTGCPRVIESPFRGFYSPCLYHSTIFLAVARGESYSQNVSTGGFRGREMPVFTLRLDYIPPSCLLLFFFFFFFFDF